MSKESPSWFVYILRCNDASLYTGVTTDLQRRLHEHNHCNKKGARYTRAKRPVELVYHQQCENRVMACKREYEIKQLSRKAKLQLLTIYANWY